MREIKGAHVVFYKKVCCERDDSKECKREIRVVLLCKRTQDAPIHQGYWSLFGGKRDAGQTPRQTVVREVTEELQLYKKRLSEKEELELNRKLLKKMKKLPNDVPIIRMDGQFFIRYFEFPLNIGMDILRLKRHKKSKKVEGEGLGWFTAEEVHHLMMRPEDRIAVTEFFRLNGV